MSTGDEESESLVDDLFRQVDDQFKDLEREYEQARQDLTGGAETTGVSSDAALEASNERFQLMSQVAELQAQLARQADELDERDRMLAELGDKIAEFEADVAQRDGLVHQLHTARQEALEEKREQARLSALLDARAAERQELTEVTRRLQNERDHAQELLATALSRFEAAETEMAKMADKLRHVEAAQETAAHEHDARAHELVESRAEMKKLADQLEEQHASVRDAEERAEKAEALAERRASESGYLNRRIDAMHEKLTAADEIDAEATRLRKELVMAERRISELERQVAAGEAEANAANAAVDAIAQRTADYDELVARIEVLETERDDAWEAASGASPGVPAPAETNVSELAYRARELGARRASEAAEDAAELPADTQSGATDVVPEAGGDTPVSDADSDTEVGDADVEAELTELQDEDVDVIEADLATLAVLSDLADDDPTQRPSTEPVTAAGGDALTISVPRIEQTSPEPAPDVSDTHVSDTHVSDTEAPQPAESDAGRPTPALGVPVVTTPLPGPPASLADLPPPAVELPVAAPVVPASPSLDRAAVRKRAILPADLEPNTPEAVEYLLDQAGVVAIVDARSTCNRTGIRPSELFERVAVIRDHFDLPIEVVVTPVSTPVGGAPDLPAIGVHHVTGADTVADRIRAICMGFPADQPLVVIAGDDHVRRAAIGQEANVVEPAAVLALATGSPAAGSPASGSPD